MVIPTPTSDAWGKDWLKDRLIDLDMHFLYKTVIDVGAGQGTYSDLLRLDLGDRWVAVEAWAEYIYMFNLSNKYDCIMISDIREHSSTLFDADLVIFGDVLEHMNKDEAEKLIIMSAVCDTIAICIPVLHLEQDAVNGNPYEVHRMENHWTADEMRAMLHRVGEKFMVDHQLEEHVGDVVAYFIMYREPFVS